MPLAYAVPLFAPIQFPVGKSAESIALNAMAVPNELSARNVRAPVEALRLPLIHRTKEPNAPLESQVSRQ